MPETTLTRLMSKVKELSEEVAKLSAEVEKLGESRGNESVAKSQRSLVIQQSKRFVNKQISEQNDTLLTTYFYSNPTKGTVVARIVGSISGKEYGKGIARVSKDDLFDENIGKAIALCRAQSREVPEAYLNAPQY